MATTTTFEYTVRDRAGKVVTGRMEATDQAALVARLRQLGHAPLSVAVAGTGLNREITLPFGRSVSLKDLAVMSRQFATMIDSGLSLLRALTILAAQTENKALAGVLASVRQDVETGQSLSVALAKHPRVFPPLMMNMCRAGEVGGFLDSTLQSVAANFEAEVKLRGKVKSAMTYPVVVFVIALLAVVGMLLFIVPIFASMFASLGGELPAPTRLLVWLSGLMKVGAPLLVVLAAVGLVVWRRVRHHHRVRSVVDPLVLRVPVFGPLFRKVAVARFCRNLGTMIRSGVPILQSLDIVGGTAGNLVLERAARDVQDSVRRGESMAAPLARHGVFPPMVVQMLAVGEDTGATDTMLEKVADFYDAEVEATTEALTSLIEPIMIAVLGAVVGGMIIAMYLPIFTIFDQIQ
ncbi:type II secretion system F family protein [Quadrisphaera sp. DSM 44207]|uniref:type II secretion system F family protein n=1 Tax=Quadrisphaera sp. DSM 44207 TaxID=1881057 RepID=UPI000883999D|nr:type II secretion system F family protein [Quadrisphaera sp. DSM 44207]SDQ46857.1 type IV pilus assembly protein PilC [Quadrisphaera sp. DSM 44207]